MKKLSIFTITAVCIVSLSGYWISKGTSNPSMFFSSNNSSEMETLWLEECVTRLAPFSSGLLSKKQCSCMYQKASKILNEKQLLSSELADNFRKINKIEIPALTEADSEKIFSTSIQVTLSCI